MRLWNADLLLFRGQNQDYKLNGFVFALSVFLISMDNKCKKYTASSVLLDELGCLHCSPNRFLAICELKHYFQNLFPKFHSTVACGGPCKLYFIIDLFAPKTSFFQHLLLVFLNLASSWLILMRFCEILNFMHVHIYE